MPAGFSIIRDEEFANANKALGAKVNFLKKSGKGNQIPHGKDLHIFCYHDLSLYSCTTLKVELFLINPSLFAPFVSVYFVDSYYSPCWPLGITPGRFDYPNAKFWADTGYGKYLIVPFWYVSVACQALLVSLWVSWLDYVSPKYELWFDQTRLICRRSVPKRYD